VVLPSLFEEQLELEGSAVNADLTRGAESSPESLSYFPDLLTYNLGPDAYLELIRKAKETASIPIIASLNGISSGGWICYAKLMEQAGANAIELNLYDITTNPHARGADLEARYCELLKEVKRTVRVPVAVKLSPFFTAPANAAKQLDDAGADALVLFNRFYQPDFDIDLQEVSPALTLSEPNELLLRLHWVGILYGKIRADLAITGGVQ